MAVTEGGSEFQAFSAVTGNAISQGGTGSSNNVVSYEFISIRILYMTIFSRTLTTACSLVVGLRLGSGLELVRGWLVVTHTYLHYFQLLLSLSPPPHTHAQLTKTARTYLKPSSFGFTALEPKPYRVSQRRERRPRLRVRFRGELLASITSSSRSLRATKNSRMPQHMHRSTTCSRTTTHAGASPLKSCTAKLFALQNFKYITHRWVRHKPVEKKALTYLHSIRVVFNWGFMEPKVSSKNIKIASEIYDKFALKVTIKQIVISAIPVTRVYFDLGHNYRVTHIHLYVLCITKYRKTMLWSIWNSTNPHVTSLHEVL